MGSSYNPKPLETDHVVVDGELLELVELLAENAHDIWARQRLQDGWVFGPERCDELRRHPCLVPYAHLSEEEKAYDRNAVLGTIRAMLALGFTVARRPHDMRGSGVDEVQGILRTVLGQEPAETKNSADVIR